mmetsp:Transcript_13680/g.43218  ORF Transcript_13680/g.43218 Transcript_13680/m.43218 type:complete len:220 (+) Transcript_13680:498-1157(+)
MRASSRTGCSSAGCTRRATGRSSARTARTAHGGCASLPTYQRSYERPILLGARSRPWRGGGPCRPRVRRYRRPAAACRAWGTACRLRRRQRLQQWPRPRSSRRLQARRWWRSWGRPCRTRRSRRPPCSPTRRTLRCRRCWPASGRSRISRMSTRSSCSMPWRPPRPPVARSPTCSISQPRRRRRVQWRRRARCKEPASSCHRSGRLAPPRRSPRRTRRT